MKLVLLAVFLAVLFLLNFAEAGENSYKRRLLHHLSTKSDVQNSSEEIIHEFMNENKKIDEKPLWRTDQKRLWNIIESPTIVALLSRLMVMSSKPNIFIEQKLITAFRYERHPKLVYVLVTDGIRSAFQAALVNMGKIQTYAETIHAVIHTTFEIIKESPLRLLKSRLSPKFQQMRIACQEAIKTAVANNWVFSNASLLLDKELGYVTKIKNATDAEYEQVQQELSDKQKELNESGIREMSKERKLEADEETQKIMQLMVEIAQLNKTQSDLQIMTDSLSEGLDILSNISQQWIKLTKFFSELSFDAEHTLHELEKLINATNRFDTTHLTMTGEKKAYMLYYLSSTAFQICRLSKLVHTFSSSYKNVSTVHLLHQRTSFCLTPLDGNDIEHQLNSECQEAKNQIQQFIEIKWQIYQGSVQSCNSTAETSPNFERFSGSTEAQ